MRLKRTLKISVDPGVLQSKLRGTVHTAVSTDLTKNILLIDQHDVHAFDIGSAETTVDLNSYNVKTIYSMTDVQIQGV